MLITGQDTEELSINRIKSQKDQISEIARISQNLLEKSFNSSTFPQRDSIAKDLKKSILQSEKTLLRLGNFQAVARQ
ncbi:hypothetical protein FGO68_gene16641 [Halteria grandinella]|uniref:Uncharacterized protein n=1 Tax=Halteria grandinella TaxID=5974 RepID=A0A8J8T0D1_HALGN|nr:hypothetical protein FGO68_gene16641 [Halteria grandinella]